MQNQTLKNELCETYNKYAQDRESGSMQDWKIAERERFLLALQKENKKSCWKSEQGQGVTAGFSKTRVLK